MPTYQGLNDRGLIGKYDYLTLDLAQTAQFYADSSTPFITSGFGERFDIEEIVDAGGGLFDVVLAASSDLSNVIAGAKLRLLRTETSAEIVVDVVATDTDKITVRSSFDIAQSTAKGVATYHPFYGGFRIQAVSNAEFELDQDNAFGNPPATITLAAGQVINTTRIKEVDVTSGAVLITLL
jgi:hypothetical protein